MRLRTELEGIRDYIVCRDKKEGCKYIYAFPLLELVSIRGRDLYHVGRAGGSGGSTKREWHPVGSIKMKQRTSTLFGVNSASNWERKCL